MNVVVLDCLSQLRGLVSQRLHFSFHVVFLDYDMPSPMHAAPFILPQLEKVTLSAWCSAAQQLDDDVHVQNVTFSSFSVKFSAIGMFIYLRRCCHHPSLRALSSNF